MKNFVKNNWKVVCAYLFVIIAIVVCIGGIFFMRKLNSVNYNNGVCEKCGGHYSYSDSVGGRYGATSYMYKCDDCGHVIRVYEIMN